MMGKITWLPIAAEHCQCTDWQVVPSVSCFVCTAECESYMTAAAFAQAVSQSAALSSCYTLGSGKTL